jgi:hypothetical protein
VLSDRAGCAVLIAELRQCRQFTQIRDAKSGDCGQ